MTTVAILIPVLRRPRNVEPLVRSIRSAGNPGVKVLFIATPGDDDEIKALADQNQAYVLMDAGYENRGDYARKINKGFLSIEAEWYFLGADDLRFHAGWLQAAMKTYATTAACVIGTNDLGNPKVLSGDHATHSLVRRDYVLECGTVDQPGKVLHEGYPHEFVDDEFVATAKWRGAWAFSRQSRVEHLHPNWNKAAMDPLYAAQPARMERGRIVFDRRKRLWQETG